MKEQQHALYRYLTMWADFTPAEARKYVNHPQKSDAIHRTASWRSESIESIYSPMEQSKNRVAA